MNLAQLIDPERAVAQPARRKPDAPAPTVRGHAAASPEDGRRGGAKLAHPGQRTVGNGSSRLALKFFAAAAAPAGSFHLAQALGTTRKLACDAISHLEHLHLIIRTNAQKPLLYRVTAAGRKACA